LTYDENILVFIQSICQVTYLNVWTNLYGSAHETFLFS
jgi:hypothetical protein